MQEELRLEIGLDSFEVVRRGKGRAVKKIYDYRDGVYTRLSGYIFRAALYYSIVYYCCISLCSCRGKTPRLIWKCDGSSSQRKRRVHDDTKTAMFMV